MNDFELLIDSTLSVAAQRNMFAEAAIQIEKEIQKADERITGRPVSVRKWVDGAPDVDEHQVTFGGSITYQFGTAEDIIQYVGELLQRNSPVGSGADKHPGLYKSSHVIFADGIEVPLGTPVPTAREYLLVNTLPYSIKIESGQSSQAPNGVYEITANQAQAQFGSAAKIEFVDYVGVFGNMAQSPNATYGKRTRLQHNKATNRFPAIRITL